MLEGHEKRAIKLKITSIVAHALQDHLPTYVEELERGSSAGHLTADVRHQKGTIDIHVFIKGTKGGMDMFAVHIKEVR